jgi:hypothetical protein
VAGKITPIPQTDNLSDWEKYASAVREAALQQVVFRGRAAEWRTFPARTEFLDTIPGGPGYDIQKLRLEVLPDMWIPALLYRPTVSRPGTPVFLNVNGHDRDGKAARYKQARCIHMARNGILALNLEWFGMGQLAIDGFSHGQLNQLDLCGSSGLAPFYLAMSRGLDLLLSQETADPERVGVAGLSGGGWQTILISSLDTRVTLCNPVAGYSGFRTRIDNFSDLGDSEQTPVDLGITADYAQLTALLAPRAALLTYNEKDNCCFASAHALPPLLEAASPVYRLYGKELRLRSHVNSDPGDHNFLLDNRQALYRMIRDQWFNGDESRFSTTETAVEAELKTADELNVPLPVPNQTFHTVASALAGSIDHQTKVTPENAGATELLRQHLQDELKAVVRPGRPEASAEESGHETIENTVVTHWKLKSADGWTIPVTEFAQSAGEKTAIVICDGGRAATSETVNRLLSSGHRVFAFDPIFFGEQKIAEREYLWALMISTAGERPLGVQSGQLLSLAGWIRNERRLMPPRLVTVGPRASVVGAVTAVLGTENFAGIEEHEPLNSLKQVVSQNLTLEKHPELFCFGLLQVTDLPVLRHLINTKKAD